jgi:hypothetical protein
MSITILKSGSKPSPITASCPWWIDDSAPVVASCPWWIDDSVTLSNTPVPASCPWLIDDPAGN